MAENEALTYFIVTRKLFKSAIWRDNPHVLKLFLYLIGMARYRKKPKKFPGFEVRRGELVTSLAIIADDNEYMERRIIKKWSRAKVSRMLDCLQKEDYIKILPDTYGTHIRVLNYDTYQKRETYLANSSETQVKRVCNASETQVRTYNKDNKDNKEKKDNNNIEKFFPPSGDQLKKNGHDWIEAESWDAFTKFRAEIKKPITETAVGFLLEVLEKNKGDQKKIISNSIAGGYPSLYPLREKGKADNWDKLRKEFCE